VSAFAFPVLKAKSPSLREKISDLDLCSAPRLDRNLADLCPSLDPFAEADEDTGETKQSQNYIHIRIQRMYF